MFLRAVLVPSDAVVEELRRVTGGLASAGLRVVAPDDLEVVLARFGNVTPDIASILVPALEEGLADVPSCQVAFVVPRIEGNLVIADLSGDVSQVGSLSATVSRIAEARGIYVDRRVFRHGVVLAEIDEALRGSAIVARLERMTMWSSSVWTTSEVTLVRTTWRGADAASDRWRRIALRSDAEPDQSARIAATSAEE